MTYFFKTKKDAVEYIYTKLDNPTPIKLQKALYFVWAFYSATYGNIDSNNSENKNSGICYPKFLFKPNFEAWQYGPVDPDVWQANSEGLYQNSDNIENKASEIVTVEKKSVYDDIFSFIDDMISQVKSVNDFGLVNRSHEDSAWEDVWKENTAHIPMDPEKIKEDYIGYVNEQSKI